MSDLTMWWLIAMGGLAALLWFTERRRKPPPPQPPAPAPMPKQERPPFRVEDLGPTLDRWKQDDKAAETAENERRQRLKDRWADVAPAVAEAVDLVNGQLLKHTIELVRDVREPGFRGDKAEPFGFGVTYELQRAGQRLFDGEHSFVVTEKMLCVANIGEIDLPLEGLTARRIADATAESVEGFLEG